MSAFAQSDKMECLDRMAGNTQLCLLGKGPGERGSTPRSFSLPPLHSSGPPLLLLFGHLPTLLCATPEPLIASS